VNGDSALELLDSITPDNPTLARGLTDLSEVVRLIGDLGVPADRYGVDLSMARGLDYYTGTVYETTLHSNPELGSICSGGRYDDLAGHFTTSRLPGVGISIGLSRLFWHLREAGLLTPTGSTVQVLVGLIDDEGLAAALQIATQLRRQGINTETTMESSQLGRQLKYAHRAGIRFLVLAGPDERARGEAMIRDLDHQTQHNAATAAVASTLSSMLERGAL
jgi:histidyl-tRNA synthetase